MRKKKWAKKKTKWGKKNLLNKPSKVRGFLLFFSFPILLFLFPVYAQYSIQLEKKMGKEKKQNGERKKQNGERKK